MKTAVDYLIEQLAKNGVLHSSDIAKAKEMEKQQIVEAYNNGIQEMIGRNNSHIMCKHYDISSEQYYNETFSE